MYDAKQIAENAKNIKFMNDMVMDLGNEYAEEMWLMVYPDGADHMDVLDMAADEMVMHWLCDAYRDVMEAYGGWK